jgi:hypothetical protein
MRPSGSWTTTVSSSLALDFTTVSNTPVTAFTWRSDPPAAKAVRPQWVDERDCPSGGRERHLELINSHQVLVAPPRQEFLHDLRVATALDEATSKDNRTHLPKLLPWIYRWRPGHLSTGLLLENGRPCYLNYRELPVICLFKGALPLHVLACPGSLFAYDTSCRKCVCCFINIHGVDY